MSDTVAKPAQRVELYDWLRLLAMLCVVIGHSAYLSIQTAHGGVSYTLPADLSPAYNGVVFQLLRYLASYVYTFHMPLFFMLSGAVLALRPVAPLDRLLLGKGKRLLLPYFVYGWLFMLPLKYLGNFYDAASFREALAAFPSGVDSGHLWFLPALFWCILCFAILVKLFDRLSIRSIAAPLLAAGAIQLLLQDRLEIGSVPGLQTSFSYLFWFALGYVFEQRGRERMRLSTPLALVLWLLLSAWQVLALKCHLVNSFFQVLGGSVHLLLLALLLFRIGGALANTKVWKFLIRNLFYVYLLHDPLEYLVLRLTFDRGLLSTAFGCWAYYGLRFPGIFVLCLFLGEGISRLKKKASQLLARKAPA